jgi:hypothetical protein
MWSGKCGLEWRYGAGNLISSTIANPLFCAYCVAQGVSFQQDNYARYLEHVTDYMSEEAGHTNGLECPHQTCKRNVWGRGELTVHFRSIHGIP